MASFEVVYEQMKHRVYNTVLSYLQSVEDAEEITQDVFLEVFDKLPSFREEALVSTWIYRIAVNKCLDFLRYKNRKKRFAYLTSLWNDDTGELKHDKPDFIHPGIKLERKEQSIQLFKALDKLPEGQKTAFILIFIEQVNYQEACKITGLGLKAMESMVQRAKKNLRTELKKYRDTEG